MSTAPTSRAPTRDDVARLAGVSTAVVSYVVNRGPRPVSDDSRRRVEEAIKKLDYRPNAAARALSTGASDLIGLVLPDAQNPYFAELSRVVEAEGRLRNISILQLSDGSSFEAHLRSMEQLTVRGLIVATNLGRDDARALAASKVPAVFVNQVDPTPHYDRFAPDYATGAYQATEHLIGHGHTRIAFVGRRDTGAERERGWRTALLDHGLEPTRRVDATFSFEGGALAAADILNQFPDATAVFIPSDQQAIGFISAATERGVRIPHDIAITSFDDTPLAAYTVPALTSVGVDLAALVNAALDSLGSGGPHRDELFVPRLHIRRSCGC